jgi:hypothetical protein
MEHKFSLAEEILLLLEATFLGPYFKTMWVLCILCFRGTQCQARDNLPKENTFILDVNFQVLLEEHILSPAGEIYLRLPQAKPFGIKV